MCSCPVDSNESSTRYRPRTTRVNVCVEMRWAISPYALDHLFNVAKTIDFCGSPSSKRKEKDITKDQPHKLDPMII
ncbi:hypothetical protein XELAEV_18046406mg [Xenopus laevis]|uniref:Uncharacterized protein n=1 Tax=Xenopus laevis TaxID=8355 RepID=A0A974BTF2_XENLA|nr:hypothetical protein XELAEV_18046406mg [Xenopus laevis]